MPAARDPHAPPFRWDLTTVHDHDGRRTLLASLRVDAPARLEVRVSGSTVSVTVREGLDATWVLAAFDSLRALLARGAAPRAAVRPRRPECARF